MKKVPIYVAEITPKNLRGAFTTAHQVFIALFIWQAAHTVCRQLLTTNYAVDDMLWCINDISYWSICVMANFGYHW